MIDIKYIIKDIKKRRDLKYWLIRLGNHFDKNYIFVDKTIFPEVITKDGDIFLLTSESVSINQVYNDYFFNDIKKDDIVIDIGANIGGFCIPASKFSDSVYAIEPIMVSELRHNIQRNNAKVHVLENAFGDGSTAEVTWNGIKKKIQSHTFNQITEITGGCDFLKCDCEGFEWFIRPDDLKGIRRIEMEIHNYNPSPYDPQLLLEAIQSDFTVVVKKNSPNQNETIIPKLHYKKYLDIDDVEIFHAYRK